MKKILDKNLFFLFVFFVSISTLVAAVYIEFVLKIKPCELCVYQRYPYILAIFGSFVGYYFSKKSLSLYILLLIFLISLILSGYHIGVEQGLFSGLEGCKGENLNIVDKKKLLNSLDDISVSCKDVSFTLFGMSLATINFIMSLMIIILTFIMIRYEKNR